MAWESQFDYFLRPCLRSIFTEIRILLAKTYLPVPVSCWLIKLTQHYMTQEWLNQCLIILHMHREKTTLAGPNNSCGDGQ